MGISLCTNPCNGRESRENKIKEAWEDCALTTLKCEEYVKIAIDFSQKNFYNVENQEKFFKQILKSNESSTFFEYIKQDVLYLIKTKNFHFQILIAFFFLTNSKNEINLNENFNYLSESIANYYKISLPLNKNQDLFIEIFLTYVRIISSFSYDAIKNSQFELNYKLNNANNIENEKIIDKAFGQPYITKYVVNLIYLKDFSINNLILQKYEKLNHNNIRDELISLVVKEKKENEVKSEINLDKKNTQKLEV